MGSSDFITTVSVLFVLITFCGGVVVTFAGIMREMGLPLNWGGVISLFTRMSTYVFSPDNISKTRVAILAVVTVGLMIVFTVFWQSAKEQPQSLPSNQANETTIEDIAKDDIQSQPEEKIYSVRTPSELMALISDEMTGIEKQAIIDRHVGHWLPVEGPLIMTTKPRTSIDGIRRIWIYVGVEKYALVDDYRTQVDMLCDFDKWEDKLRGLSIGDVVVAEGEIDSFDSNDVVIKKCEIKETKRREETEDDTEGSTATREN